MRLQRNLPVTGAAAWSGGRGANRQSERHGMLAPGKDAAIRLNITLYLLNKILVVFATEKYLLPVVALVVNMVYATWFEMHVVYI